MVGEEPEYEEKLDEAPKSILMGMMRQLKVGMDLSRITLPAFILEPRSFLEKCSDFMSHGQHLLRYAQNLLFHRQNLVDSNLISEFLAWRFHTSFWAGSVKFKIPLSGCLLSLDGISALGTLSHRYLFVSCSYLDGV